MPYSLPLLIASDHAGLSLKTHLIAKASPWNWKDLGTFQSKRTDYPVWAKTLCDQMQAQLFGVLICGSGQGMVMKANRYSHIRAALCMNEEMARLARKHNNANVLCFGQNFVTQTEAVKILEVFLNTSFNTEDSTYLKRVNQL